MLSCHDRVVITGTYSTVCYADGITRFQYASGIRIFDDLDFASTLRDRVDERAASLAADAGVTIEPIANRPVRKEKGVAKLLERSGGQAPGNGGGVPVQSALA